MSMWSRIQRGWAELRRWVPAQVSWRWLLRTTTDNIVTLIHREQEGSSDLLVPSRSKICQKVCPFYGSHSSMSACCSLNGLKLHHFTSKFPRFPYRRGYPIPHSTPVAPPWLWDYSSRLATSQIIISLHLDL